MPKIVQLIRFKARVHFPLQSSALCTILFFPSLCIHPSITLFFFKHLYWSIIALSRCVSFRSITKCISHTYTYVLISPPSCISLPPSPSHPSRWSQSTELISLRPAAASHPSITLKEQKAFLWLWGDRAVGARTTVPLPVRHQVAP